MKPIVKKSLVIGPAIVVVLISLALLIFFNPMGKYLMFSKYEIDGSFQGDKMAYFNFITDVIQDGYPYLEIKEKQLGFVWQEIVAYYQPIIRNTSSEKDFLYLCKEMLTLLGDRGHTELMIDKKIYFERTAPIDIDKSDEGYIISSFRGDFANKYPFLKPGMKIQRLDGRNPHLVVEILLENTGYGLLEQGERILLKNFFTTYYMRFLKKRGINESDIEFIDEQGQLHHAQLTYYEGQGKGPTGIKHHRGYKREIGSKAISPEIGYLKVNSLSNNHISDTEIEKAMDQIKDCQSIIIDLRYNMGGNFLKYGRKIISYFIDKPITSPGVSYYRNSKYFRMYGKLKEPYQWIDLNKEEYYTLPETKIEPADNPYFANKDIYILTNRHHYSSGSTLIATFADNKLGTIIGRGEVTYPQYGEPLRIRTPWRKWGIRYNCMFRTLDRDNLAEEIVYKPDIYIPLTLDTILGKEDPILTEALRWIGVE